MYKLIDLKDEVYISYEMMKDWWYILCVQAMYSRGLVLNISQCIWK